MFFCLFDYAGVLFCFLVIIYTYQQHVACVGFEDFGISI
jgi:hypothetical protein